MLATNPIAGVTVTTNESNILEWTLHLSAPVRTQTTNIKIKITN